MVNNDILIYLVILSTTIFICIYVYIYYLKLTSPDQHYNESTKSSLMSFCVSFCHFLECLYDPYQIWRCFDSSQMKDLDMSKLQYSPSMLHVEVVPFIFGMSEQNVINVQITLITKLSILFLDCFETNLAKKYPSLAAELLNVFGAIVCGSQVTFCY